MKPRVSTLVATLVLLGGLVFLSSPASAACHIVAFSQSNYTVGEGDGAVQITITRQIFGMGCTGFVEWSTRDGTATHPEDYTETTGRHDFVDSTESSVTFEVPIADDSAFEGDETFEVRFTGENRGASSGMATVTINDNDPSPAPAEEEAAETPSPSPTPEESPTETPDAEADGEAVADQEEDGGSATPIIIAIVAIAVAGGIGVGWWRLRRRPA